jgi:AmmeMemoRadiSam system protein B
MRTESEPSRVRPPAVAGTFYPGRPERLREVVEALLAAAAREGGEAPLPKALIAPHAGYAYSGPIAAAAFAALGGAAPLRRVVVIGPTHHVRMRGIAAPTAAAFATPLGSVEVDQEALAALADLGCVARADGPHAPEHALEVELPFLQVVGAEVAIVPLLVGEAAPEEVAAVLGRLWGGAETLILVSSDLSHFHDYATARRRDAATAAAIERGDWAALGPGEACGFLAVAGLLIEGGRRGLGGARRLALANSGDTAGGRDSVVGYGAWRFDAAA